MSEQIFRTERENYVINTKEVLSVALDSVILLENVSHSLNNLCREKLRPTLSRDPQYHCDSSNSVTSSLLRDGLLKRIKEAEETARITLYQKPQRSHNNSGLPKLNLSMVNYTPNQCDEFQVGRLKNYIKIWEAITEDPEIIETVSDLKLNFIDNPLFCLPLVI